MQRRTFQWVFLLVVFTAVSIATLSAQAQTATPRPTANLVLIIGNSPVYNTPNGTPIARLEVRVCQTFFLGATSADGQFVQLQGLGNGWVPVGVISDVPENYAQRGGAPVNSGCPASSNAATSTPALISSVTASVSVTTRSAPATPVTIPTLSVTRPNLVLIVSETPLLNVPAGNALGTARVRNCQTFFAVAVSEDGQYYRLSVPPSGGWVIASAIQDVSEDYGQRNGQPRIC